MPFAPGRFSTITGCPTDSVIWAPIWRARISGELPGGEGTRMRIGFDGKDCAAASPASVARVQARRVFFMGSLRAERGILRIAYDERHPPAREGSPMKGLASIAAAALATFAVPVLSQSAAQWPERPVRLIVTVGAGGAAD